ncbi:MAG: YXWGXW repeat-containing protein [Isosphaeraceae bacterium]
MAIPRVPGRSGRCSLLVFAVLVAWSVGMMGASASWGQEPPPDPTPVTDATPPQGGPAEDPATADPQGGQVLTQGPVHEAFAAPVVHDPKAGPVVAKAPPDPIQELPPDQKPSGQNIQWIPGYWAWDTTRNDYLWVSGIWREPPPNTQWVPGYWHQVDDGNQWVPGSWMPVSSGQSQGQVQASGQAQATYMPPPPASLEAGPNTPQPSPNVAWTPGYWTWQGNAYAWRPGFWANVQPNWIWIPPHYVWTPSGYLFVPGYWDLPVANRGLMFAPVYYPQPVYAQPGFAFTPSISIVGSAVTANLFVQASTNQYLFGNYYAQTNVSVGIVPWFSFSFSVGRPMYYDPLFSYYAVVNVRQNPQWIVQARQAYILRRDNVVMRPPGTYAEQIRIERSATFTRDITVVDHRTMGMSLSRLAADPIAGRNLRMVRVSEAERQQIRHQVAQLHQAREQRAHQEREAARNGVPNRPRTVGMPHSPIAARTAPHPAAGHPGGHPAAHPGGARAEVARRGEEGRASARGAEAHAGRPEAEAPRAEAARRPAARPAQRQPARPAQRGRTTRPAESEERERRPGF